MKLLHMLSNGSVVIAGVLALIVLSCVCPEILDNGSEDLI